MYRQFMFAGLASLALAGAALAYQEQSNETASTAATPAEAPTAEAFAQSLITAIDMTLTANPTLTDYPDLELRLEQAIEAAFVTSNAAPDVAMLGVEVAQAKLSSAGTMCELPDNRIPTKRCEAVALAFVLARNAAQAAQTDATSAIASPGTAALGAPPATGSGGGGGGVTHPPVAN